MPSMGKAKGVIHFIRDAKKMDGNFTTLTLLFILSLLAPYP
jgi:hypothetical protein